MIVEHKAGAMNLAEPLVHAFLGGLAGEFDGDAHWRDPPRILGRVSHRLARHVPLQPIRMVPGRPMVSFTFDDVPDSARSAGASILEEHGARGTFYVAGSLLGVRTRDWRVIDGDGVAELAARSHEIGCHTFAHLRADRLTASGVAHDVLRNREMLRAIEPRLALENFAYPFGYGAFGWKRKLAPVFRSCRGIVPGIHRDRLDPQFLRAVPLMESRTDEDGIDRLLDRTREKGGWLVFYSHDVSARPSEHGCTPKLLAHALRAAARRGIASVSVAAAMARIAG